MNKRSTEDSWLQLYLPNEIPEIELYNYETQIAALAAIALTAVNVKSKTAMIFGFPGTGKSAAPFSLTKLLNREFSLNFSIAVINCDFALYQGRGVIETLNRAQQWVNNHQPALLCLEEIEAFHPLTREHKAYAYWLASLLKNPPKKTLVLGITNYPLNLDHSLYRSLQIPIYFHPSDLPIIERIIEKKLGLNQYKDIARIYLREMHKFRFYPLGSDVISGCEELKYSEPNLADLSATEIVRRLLAYSGTCTTDEFIKKYETQYAGLIRLSMESVLPFWKQQYEALLGV